MELPGCPGLRGSPEPGIPSAIEEVFNKLRDEITHLHIRWETCMELFLEKESVSALNEVAPGAFSVIWQVFKDDFFTTLYRITDKKEFGKGKGAKPNLTLAQLNHAIDLLGGDQAFHKKMTVKL